jgi:hypothetical protein
MILDSARLTELRGKIAASDWTWSDATFGLKARCDALATHPVYPLRSPDERYSYNVAYSRYNTSTNISSEYQGSGYATAAKALGVCYQANLIDNPALAATYGAKLAQVSGVLAVTPGRALSARTITSVDKGSATTFHYTGKALAVREAIEVSGATGDWAVLNGIWSASNVSSTAFQLLADTSSFAGTFNGVVNLAAYIADSGWQSGTAWQNGVTVSGDQSTSGQIVLAGLAANGTILAGDAFVVTHGTSRYVYVAAANTTANGSGVATVSLCSSCTTNQNTGAYVNMAYRTGGFSDGDAVTREIVLLSGSHGFATGDTVVVSGVAGNTGANGTFTVTTLDSSHFLLQGTTMGNTPQTNLMWDAGVNASFGSRYFLPAAAYAYDWGYDLLTADQRAALRSQLNVWRVMGFKLNTVAFGGNGYGHPMGNYNEGTVYGMFLAALAQEPEDPFQTLVYGALRSMFWDRIGYSSGNYWYPSGIADYFSSYATDWYYGDGPFYGNGSTNNVLTLLLTLKTAKGYDPLTDVHPFLWAPGQFYLHTTLNNRMTEGLRTSLNSSNGGLVADRDAHRWLPSTLASIQAYLRAAGDPFAPYFTSFAADSLEALKTVPYSSGPSAIWPWGTGEKTSLFLYYVSSAPATDYKTLPTNYVSTKQPELLWRTDWTSTGDWFAFNASSRVNDPGSAKYSYDSGALYIARAGGNLLTNPIMEYFKYGQIAFAYEAMTSQPRFANVFQVGSTSQPYRQTSNGPSAYGWDPNGCHNVMPTLTADVQSGYVYAKGSGLEKMYPNAAGGDACGPARAVTKWTRKVLQIKNTNQTTFVHDITGIYDSAWDQMMVWSFGGPGEAASAPAGMHRFDIGPGGPATSYLGSVYSIYPVSHMTKYGDPKDGTVFTTAISSAFQTNATSRLEVRPSGAPANTTWLTMFDLAASGGSAYTPTALEGENVDAVQLNDPGNSVVAFPKDDPPSTPLTYSFSESASVTHYVGGLATSTPYKVDWSSVPGKVRISAADGGSDNATTTAAGVLSFVTTIQQITPVTMQATPVSVTFDCAAGGPNPASRTIHFTTEGNALRHFTASATETWLSVTPSSGTAAADLSVAVDCSNLGPGNPTGNIIIESPDSGVVNSPLILTVGVQVGPPEPNVLTVDQPSLTFDHVMGSALPQAQILTAVPSEAGTTISASSTASWLSALDRSGYTLTVSVDPSASSLLPGVYQSSVAVNCQPSCEGGTTNIPISLTVRAAANGLVSRVFTTPSRAVFVYNAPSGAPCRFQGATASDFATIVADGWDSGSTRLRQVVVGDNPSLTPGTSYYFRAICGTTEIRTPFSTVASAPAGMGSVDVVAAPPAGLRASALRVEYGSSSEVLDGHAESECSSTCRVTITGGNRSVYFARRKWMNTDGEVMAVSSVYPLAIP